MNRIRALMLSALTALTLAGVSGPAAAGARTDPALNGFHAPEGDGPSSGHALEYDDNDVFWVYSVYYKASAGDAWRYYETYNEVEDAQLARNDLAEAGAYDVRIVRRKGP